MTEEDIVIKTRIKNIAYCLVMGNLLRYITTPIVLLFFIIPKPETDSSGLFYLIGAFLLAGVDISIMITSAVYLVKGRRWARNLIYISTIMGILIGLFWLFNYIFTKPSVDDKTIYFLQLALGFLFNAIILFYLLFSKTAKEYFSQKPNA
ncbi:MAG: hypothetical protein Q8L29_03420 [archaeon]|nr:hypothetical protein [archaeon]